MSYPFESVCWKCKLRHPMPMEYDHCATCKSWNGAPDPARPLAVVPEVSPVYWVWRCSAKQEGGERCNWLVDWRRTTCHRSGCGGKKPPKGTGLIRPGFPTRPPKEFQDADKDGIDDSAKGNWGQHAVDGCPDACQVPHQFVFGVSVVGAAEVYYSEPVELEARIVPPINPAKPVGTLRWKITRGGDFARFQQSGKASYETHAADTQATVEAKGPGTVEVECVFQFGKEVFPSPSESFPTNTATLKFTGVESDTAVATSLYLSGGGKKTKSKPADEHEPTFCFAPGADTIQIHYAIEDPEEKQPSARFELRTIGRDEVLWSNAVADTTPGKKSIDWDGSLSDADKDTFPQGHVSLEHSPYELRIVFPGNEDPASQAWTRFELRAADVEVSLLDPDLLDGFVDRLGLLEETVTPPGSSSDADYARVFPLPGNIFALTYDDMISETADAKTYESMVAHREIPLRARLWLEDVNGNRVSAPKGSAARFLWEAQCTNGKLHPSDRVFPAKQGWGDLPFPVEAEGGGGRAAVSYGSREGVLPDSSGVVFRPPMRTGYEFRAQVSVIDSYSTFVQIMKGEGAPSGLKSATTAAVKFGARTVSIREVRWKHESLLYEPGEGDVKWDEVAGILADGNIRLNMEDCLTAGLSHLEVEGAIRSYIESPPVTPAKLAVAESQPLSPDLEAVLFRPFDEWKAAYAEEIARPLYESGNNLVPFDAWLDLHLKSEEGLPSHEIGYGGHIPGWSKEVITGSYGDLLIDDERSGISVLLFSALGKVVPSLTIDPVNGWAMDSPKGVPRTRGMVLVCTPLSTTTAHEIGHMLFLHHHNAVDSHFHDGHCLMAEGGSPRKAARFCRVCRLRLRGWSVRQLLDLKLIDPPAEKQG